MTARISFYKTRIQRLLDKEKREGLSKECRGFATSLQTGDVWALAPDVWIASGLLVIKDGFPELLCPAAQKAIYDCSI